MSKGYASHLTLVSAAFQVTTGPVLELGTGLGSTLMLHGLCGATGRHLHSVESNRQWFDELSPEYTRDWHTFRLVEDFLDLPEYKAGEYGTNADPWGFAFVDHGFIDQRHVSIMALHQVPMIVVHDTCHPHLYHYDEAFRDFKYEYCLKLYGPHTSVVSNTIDVASIFSEFDL